MTARAMQTAVASGSRPALWLWPVAAAVLSAWPVWRSIAPESPDIGEGWFRLELVLGAGLALLYCAWAWPRRKRIRDLAFPFWFILLAVYGVFAETRDGNAMGADLCVLAIAWTACTAIFASLALLQGGAGDAVAEAKRLHGLTLFPPSLPLLIGYGGGYLAILFSTTLPQSVMAIMGLISPGAILAWAAMSDTAGSVLAGRRVFFTRAEFLLVLARLRRWRLMSPAILLNDRPKLIGLYPAEGVKPGDLAALAAALTMDDDSELGRAIQEFGVSHRIRLPMLKEAPGQPAMQGRRAALPNGVEIELCDQAALADGGFDLTASAEAIALAQSLSREVLAVVERRPQSRVLGLIVFAIGSRPGATATLQSLRSQGIDVVLTAPPRDVRDEPALKPLQIASMTNAAEWPDQAVAVVRPHQSDSSGALLLCFGTARRSPGAPAAHFLVAREDPRTLADLVRFAADFRARTLIVILLANAPGWVLIAAALGYVQVSPLLVTGVSVIGIALAVATPQVLRLSPTLAKEVDEE